jgi:hypothetical protein
VHRSLALLLALTASCSGDDADHHDHKPVDLSPPFTCADRPDDTSGYLQPICQYIVSQLGEYEIDPNTLEIETITPMGDHDEVRLSCCYTGDIATMDRTTRTVLGFSLGDI